MNLTTDFGNALLLLIFNNDNIANVGDATGLRGSSVAGSLYMSYHTADPGIGGSQTANEASYTGYARKAVARSTAGFTVTGKQVVNAADVTFDEASSSQDIKYIGIGTSLSGAGRLLARAPISTSFQGPFVAATSDTLTIPGHSLSVNDEIAFFAVTGSSLPTGITQSVFYFVKTVSGEDITISATLGGATLDVTGVGDGLCFKVTTRSVTAGVIPKVLAGQFVFNID